MNENLFHAGALAMFVVLCIGAASHGGREQATQVAANTFPNRCRDGPSQSPHSRTRAARGLRGPRDRLTQPAATVASYPR